MASTVARRLTIRHNLYSSTLFFHSRVLQKDGILLFSKSQSTSVAPKQFNLSFEEYLKLKRSLKTKQRVAGVPFALTGMAVSSMVAAYMFPEMFDATPENVQLIWGLDPIMFSGISGVASAGVSYVIGTNIFKFLWNQMNKEDSNNLNERDVDFLQRLEKYRFQADSKFEDDYYGETIKTLSDYRQWVRTHQKKRETHEKFNSNNMPTNE